MCPFQGLVVLVEMAHDGFPNEAGLLKFFALFRQLLPNVFPLENVLEGWKKESEDACGVSVLKFLLLQYYLQVDPLALHSEHHLCHLKHH